MAGLDQMLEKFIRTHPFMPLIEEIDKLKQTLCELDVNGSTFSYRIKEHARRLQAKIPPNPGDISCLVKILPTSYDPSVRPARVPDTYCPYPLCRLLNKDKCCPKEIPLSILELLVTAGLDVNGTSYNYYQKGQTCLHAAIDSGHFNAVRWLVEHGADCNAKVNGQTCLHSAIDSGHYNAVKLLLERGADCNAKGNGQTCLHSAIDSGRYDVVTLLVEHGADCNAMNHENFRHKTPIVSLASRPNVPLDLFDLLKTPENLNDSRNKRLPLHEAIRHGCINSALYLISLGAEVNKIDAYYECLPIECYIGWASDYHVLERFEFHKELFIKLLPPSCMNTVEIISKITSNNFELDVASKMIYPLLQRHVKTGNISLGIRAYRKHDDVYQIFYLKSLLVLLLDLDITLMRDIAEIMKSMTDESWKQAVNDIWKAYDQQHGKVKSLFKLCIQCTRQSMSSLDDDSFQNLEPLPSKIRNLLMLQDVAEVMCKALKLWPECIKVQDIIDNCQ